MRFGFISRLSALVLLVLGMTHLVHGRLMSPEEARAFQDELHKTLAILQQSDNVRHTNDQPTIDKLQALTVSGVRWPNRDIKAVAADLETWSKEADPNHISIHFVVKLPADPAHPDVLGHPIQRLVCVILPAKMPFASLLTRISEATNLAYRVNKGSVTFEQWRPDDFFFPPDMDM